MYYRALYYYDVRELVAQLLDAWHQLISHELSGLSLIDPMLAVELWFRHHLMRNHYMRLDDLPHALTPPSHLLAALHNGFYIAHPRLEQLLARVVNSNPHRYGEDRGVLRVNDLDLILDYRAAPHSGRYCNRLRLL